MLTDRSSSRRTCRAPSRVSRRRPGLEPLEARQLLTNLYVSPQGSDANAPGNPVAPLKSIQHAVNIAQDGDVIRVAAGNYRYDQAADAEGGHSQKYGSKSVVAVDNKSLSIIGGYDPKDFSRPPDLQTAIDANFLGRGILIDGTAKPGTSVLIKGLSVTLGRGRDVPKGFMVDADAAGGGIFSDGATLSLEQVLISSSNALGGDRTTPVGGKAVGGGLYLRSSTPATLTDVRFNNDGAYGGEGTVRGGSAWGGALYLDGSVVDGSHVEFESNRAQGGKTTGIGIVDGQLADARGGGSALVDGSTLDLVNASFIGDVAEGGNAPNGNGGGGYGGGIYADASRVTLRASKITSGGALGGAGPRNQSLGAGLAEGGGIWARDSNVTIDRTSVSYNVARGGPGVDVRAQALGGGIALLGGSADVRATITTSVFEQNAAERGSGQDASRTGGGGAIWIDGPTTAIAQSTFARNQLSAGTLPPTGQQGMAILVGTSRPTTLNLWYSIVADHRNIATAALIPPAIVVTPGSTANLKRELFANNARDTNEPARPTAGGPIYTHALPDIVANAAGFVAAGVPRPGGSRFDRTDLRITSDSAAVNAATGSTAGIDIDGKPRVGVPDIGASEAVGLVIPNGLPDYYRASQRGLVPIVADFNGDGADDVAIYGPSGDGFSGFVVISFTGSHDFPGPLVGIASQSFGGLADVPVAADYDGDGKADYAVYGPSGNGFNRYAVLLSTTGKTITLGFGGPADVPVVGDYDGDGKADYAVYGPAGNGFNRFAIRGSAAGTTVLTNFGGLQDVAIAGDFDGDRRTDIAVYGPAGNGVNRFAVLQSKNGFASAPFGVTGDRPLATDFDGDGVDDIAVYGPDRRGFQRFAVSRSPTGYFEQSFGGLTDVPVVADLDGDRRTDIAVYGDSGFNGNGRLAAIIGTLQSVTFPTEPSAPSSIATATRSAVPEVAIVPLQGPSTPALELFRHGRSRGEFLA